MYPLTNFFCHLCHNFKMKKWCCGVVLQLATTPYFKIKGSTHFGHSQFVCLVCNVCAFARVFFFLFFGFTFRISIFFIPTTLPLACHFAICHLLLCHLLFHCLPLVTYLLFCCLSLVILLLTTYCSTTCNSLLCHSVLVSSLLVAYGFIVYHCVTLLLVTSLLHCLLLHHLLLRHLLFCC